MVHARVLQARSVRWHSRSPGQPFRFWDILPGDPTPFDIERILEPMVVFAAGLILSSVNPFGIAVMAAAVMLFVKKWMEYAQFRGALLDQIDGQIEAEVMAAWVDENPVRWETKGYIVPKIAMKGAQAGPSVAEAMERVSGTESPQAARASAVGAIDATVRHAIHPALDGGPRRLE